MQPDRAQIDALTEIVSVGIEQAAKLLSDLVRARVRLQVATIELCTFGEVANWLRSVPPGTSMAVRETFRGLASGQAVLVFPELGGARLAQLAGRLEAMPEVFDVDLASILTEIGNILLNGIVGSLADALGGTLFYTVPQFLTAQAILQALEVDEACQRQALQIEADFDIADHSIKACVLLAFDGDGIQRVLGLMLDRASA